MFSTPQSLKKRTGRYGIDRPTYLKQLQDEYNNSLTTNEKKEQILANLANFAYDPINYEYFRRFNILDIFIDNLKLVSANDSALCSSMRSITSTQLDFSIAALCNLCLDVKNKEILIRNNVVKLLSHYLLMSYQSQSTTNMETILNALTILIFMFESDHRCQAEILNDKNLLNLLNELSVVKSNNRLSNLANLFLNDYLTTAQVKDEPMKI